MEPTDYIDINCLNDLEHYIKSMTFSVEWKVTSEIGPDWIGSSREICFYLDNYQLTDNEFHSLLKSKLIERLNIPEHSKDHVITGKGELEINGTKLKLHYSWGAAIPYDYPDKRGNGTEVLYL